MRTSEEGTNFGISIGLAFVGGYADAASFLMAHTFTGHLTGNSVLAAVSAASKEWSLAGDRLLAAVVFLAGILVSLTLGRFIPSRLKRYSLAISLSIEIVLILSAGLLLSDQVGNEQLFIVCMCLAMGIQNDALRKTNGVSVHSTYMTGMVTTLVQKSFQYFFPKQSADDASAMHSTSVAVRILAPMWLSFLIGAVAGAVIVASFHRGGLLILVLPLVILIYMEVKSRLAVFSPEG